MKRSINILLAVLLLALCGFAMVKVCLSLYSVSRDMIINLYQDITEDETDMDMVLTDDIILTEPNNSSEAISAVYDNDSDKDSNTVYDKDLSENISYAYGFDSADTSDNISSDLQEIMAAAGVDEAVAKGYIIKINNDRLQLIALDNSQAVDDFGMDYPDEALSSLTEAELAELIAGIYVYSIEEAYMVLESYFS